MSNEYEVIKHNNTNFHVFLVNLFYRTPHIHKDFEIGLLMEGEVNMITHENTHILHSGDIYILNPYQSHEIQAKTPSPILSLQVSPAFFSSYYPQIENSEITQNFFHMDTSHDFCLLVSRFLLDIASAYYMKKTLNEIQCAVWINQLFFEILKTVPFHLYTDQERLASQSKGIRMRKIINYIDSHYTEKILLSDIAEQENINLYYASHFFKKIFGITFQEYVTKLRCEHARGLLLLTDHSLLDISLSSGFSDPKYFNRGFKKQYGCLPKEYRKHFHNIELPQQQKSMLSTQEFLSMETSLVILEEYKESRFEI